MAGQRVEIVPFEENHRQAVIDLWTKDGIDSAPHNEPATAINNKLALDRELFLVAVIDGEVVGTAMGGYDGHRGWLYSVKVREASRRCGVGTALLERVERLLRERGCLKLNLQVMSGNLGAVAFYEDLGYRVEERISMGKRLYSDDLA
jgi:ribosomal protein S18 acetylase RimI-like enzyme